MYQRKQVKVMETTHTHTHTIDATDWFIFECKVSFFFVDFEKFIVITCIRDSLERKRDTNLNPHIKF